MITSLSDTFCLATLEQDNNNTFMLYCNIHLLFLEIEIKLILLMFQISRDRFNMDFAIFRSPFLNRKAISIVEQKCLNKRIVYSIRTFFLNTTFLPLLFAYIVQFMSNEPSKKKNGQKVETD